MNVAARRTIRSVPPDLSKSEVKEVSEVKEEGNLLIEAVSLLVQRQRETEGWVAEQIWQAEERAAAAERRYAELEDRLDGIEEHLSRLVNELEPAPGGNAEVDQRLSRLREQVEDLKTVGTDGRPAVSPRMSPIAEAAQPRSREVESVSAPDERSPQTPGRAARYADTPAPSELPGRGVRYADTPAPSELPGRATRYADTPAPSESPAESTRPTDRSTGIVGAPPAAVASAPRAGATGASTDVGFLDLLGSSPADRWGAVLIAAGAVAVLFAVLTSLRFG
jgi:archaellum component FlaC